MLAGTLSANAQKQDPVEQSFFPPELIMAHQEMIQLTQEQRNAIKDLMKKFQGEFMDLNWEMNELTTDLVNVISKPRVDETAALAQLDQVLRMENQIKKKQITLMIRIKNELTEEQQQKLMEAR